MILMEHSYRNNNNNQQNNSGYPNNNTRGSFYNNYKNNNNKNQKKKRNNNNNNNNNNITNNENTFNRSLNNRNNNQNQYYPHHQQQQEAHSLPQNFINNYVTNIPTPQNYEMSNSYDSSMPSYKPYLANHNRSPNKHHNYRNNKQFRKSNSNHNMQENNNYNNNNMINSNNSLEYSPKRGVTASPSDSAINTHLYTSGEFNAILNNLRASPTKLTPFVEETKLIITESKFTTSSQLSLSGDMADEGVQAATFIAHKNDFKISKEETTVQFDQDTNLAVVNTLNVSIENTELQIERDYENNGGTKSADQSEISENQYFSANETNQASTSTSPATTSTETSPSRGGLTASSSTTNTSSPASNSYVTNDDSNDESLVKCDDTVNKTINNEMNNTEIKESTINQETQEDEQKNETENGEKNLISHDEHIDYIESEGDYPRIKTNVDEADKESMNHNNNNNNNDDEINKKESVIIDNNNQVDDSMNSTTSTKTITSNISDLEINTDSSSKSSEFSDLENLKIRTIDIESDENICDSSDKSNESGDAGNKDDLAQNEIAGLIEKVVTEGHDEDKKLELEGENLEVELQASECVDTENKSEKVDENLINFLENFDTESSKPVENLVEITQEPFNLEQSEPEKQTNDEKLDEVKNEQIFDEELKEIVEKIVGEVITNAVAFIEKTDDEIVAFEESNDVGKEINLDEISPSVDENVQIESVNQDKNGIEEIAATVIEQPTTIPEAAPIEENTVENVHVETINQDENRVEVMNATSTETPTVTARTAPTDTPQYDNDQIITAAPSIVEPQNTEIESPKVDVTQTIIENQNEKTSELSETNLVTDQFETNITSTETESSNAEITQAISEKQENETEKTGVLSDTQLVTDPFEINITNGSETEFSKVEVAQNASEIQENQNEKTNDLPEIQLVSDPFEVEPAKSVTANIEATSSEPLLEVEKEQIEAAVEEDEKISDEQPQTKAIDETFESQTVAAEEKPTEIYDPFAIVMTPVLAETKVLDPFAIETTPVLVEKPTETTEQVNERKEIKQQTTGNEAVIEASIENANAITIAQENSTNDARVEVTEVIPTTDIVSINETENTKEGDSNDIVIEKVEIEAVIPPRADSDTIKTVDSTDFENVLISNLVSNQPIETENVFVNIEEGTENEIINSEIQQIEPLKAHYNDEDDFDLCDDNELKITKQPNQQQPPSQEINLESEDNIIDKDTVLINSAIDNLSKNLENEEKVEKIDVCNNKSFLEEIVQNDKPVIEQIDIQEAIDNKEEEATVTLNITSSADNQQASVLDSTTTSTSTKKSEDKKTKSKKVANSAEIDCFGCSIL